MTHAGQLGLPLDVPFRPLGWNRGFALSLIVAALLCSPWTIRNYAIFHRFIPIRDNSGLAVRVSYNPFAVVSVRDSTVAFYQYEPFVNPLRQ